MRKVSALVGSALVLGACATGGQGGPEQAQTSTRTPVPNVGANQSAGDRQITHTLVNQMINDPQLRTAPIEVRTQDGVVSLSGSVDNLQAKQRAADLARAAEGVLAVYDAVQVVVPRVPDETVQQQVQQGLAANPATQAAQVRVAVRDGVVTLSGNAGNWTAKRVGSAVAQQVRGVRAVRNDLSVPPESHADQQVQAEVEQRLREDPALRTARIDVQVQDGKVVLQGVVASAEQKGQALAAASVPGVAAVDGSGLSVRAPGSAGEAGPVDVSQALRTALAKDPRLSASTLDAEVSNGVAVLRGTVDTLAARLAAESVARKLPGVAQVDNQIVVLPPGVIPDVQLQQQVQDVFGKDPYLEGQGVRVRAHGGTVYLEGKVSGEYQRTRARDLASRVKGVVNVYDQLQVQGQPAPEAPGSTATPPPPGP